MEYIIDPEFAGLHRKLSILELEQLEANCVEDGAIHDPIMVWGQYILDGRHRLPIAQKHGLPYDVKEVVLLSRDDAKRWVINNQLGKRNLSDGEMQRLRAEQAKLRGTKIVADTHNLSPRTVQRDIEVENAMEELPEDLRKRIKSGSLISTRRSLKQYGDLTPDQQKAVNEALRAFPSLTLQQALPKKTASALSPADYDDINSCPNISQKNKQSLACETIAATSKGVAKLKKMKPEHQVMVNELLNDPSIESLDEAIQHFEVGLQPLKATDRAGKIKNKLTKLLNDVLRTLDDYKAERPSEMHAECISKTKELLKALENWEEAGE